MGVTRREEVVHGLAEEEVASRSLEPPYDAESLQTVGITPYFVLSELLIKLCLTESKLLGTYESSSSGPELPVTR